MIQQHVHFFFASGASHKKRKDYPVKLGDYPLEENTTYEEVISMLTQKRILPPIEPPFYYEVMVYLFESPLNISDYWFAPLKEGQPLADTLTDIISHSPEGELLENMRLDGRLLIKCVISVSFSFSLKGKPSSISPRLGETITTDLASREATAIANFITIVTGLTALIGVLRLVRKQWSKKHAADVVSPKGRSSQPSESDIVAIRLRMTHGPDHEFEEWLTDSGRLKHYIDVFNQPSSSIQPLHAAFMQRNGRAIKVDVSKGTQDNLQLNEVLSYLNIDSVQK